MSAPTLPSAPVTPVAAKKKSRRKLYIVLGALATLAVIGVAVGKSRSQEKPTMVTTEKAVVKTITQLVNATGKIQPEIEVKIAPEVSGEIIEFPLHETDVVKKGDLLVRIKPDNYKYQVDQSYANLAAAKAFAAESKAQLSKATEDFKRSEDLFAKKLIPDSEYTAARTASEAAQANYESALAQIQRAEGLLKQAQDLLDKTVIFSPVDGTVSSRTSEIGERVVGTGSFAGTEVMRLADLSKMEVRVNVNENDVVNVKVGDLARINIDAYPNRKFSGVVKEIAATAKVTGLNTQEEVTNFLVKIRVTEKDVLLRPGMSATADIETQTVENVVAVPIQSVTVRSREGSKTIDQLAQDREMKAKQNQGDGAAAAVDAKKQRANEKSDRESLQRVVFLRTGNTVKMVNVETGIADTTHIQIKSGLKKDDEVVSGPFSVITRILKDGAKVMIQPPPAKPGEKK